MTRKKLPELDAAKLAEINKIDKVEAAAWKAWELSLKHTSSRSVTGNKSTIRVINGKGDPRWLAEVRNCIRLRSEILQLLEPTPIDPDNLPPLLDIEIHSIKLDEPPIVGEVEGLVE
jgi:hypothetical protein